MEEWRDSGGRRDWQSEGEGNRSGSGSQCSQPVRDGRKKLEQMAERRRAAHEEESQKRAMELEEATGRGKDLDAAEVLGSFDPLVPITGGGDVSDSDVSLSMVAHLRCRCFPVMEIRGRGGGRGCWLGREEGSGESNTTRKAKSERGGGPRSSGYDAAERAEQACPTTQGIQQPCDGAAGGKRKG